MIIDTGSFIPDEGLIDVLAPLEGHEVVATVKMGAWPASDFTGTASLSDRTGLWLFWVSPPPGVMADAMPARLDQIEKVVVRS